MRIATDLVVTLDYCLADARSGEVLDEDTVAYVHGRAASLFPAAQAALEGHAVGDAVSVDLGVADAYGARDESCTRTVPAAQLPPGIAVGAMLRGQGDDGLPLVFHVTAIEGEHVRLDANHPLAGRALRFAATLREIRAATPEELAHGHAHVHGAGAGAGADAGAGGGAC